MFLLQDSHVFSITYELPEFLSLPVNYKEASSIRVVRAGLLLVDEVDLHVPGGLYKL